MNTPATPPTLTEMKLPAQMKDLINKALDKARPIAVAYVSADGRPELSFRGSVQPYGDSQLAIWVRNPEGGMHSGILKNPNVTLLYGDMTPDSRAFLTFRGKARFDSSDSARRTVYDNSHPLERDRDKERKGLALIIDLDSIDGFMPGAMVKIRR